MKQTNKLKIEYVPKESLKPYLNNAKIHTAEQIEQIKKSIEEFSFNDPIAIWKDNVIIEGHVMEKDGYKVIGLSKIPRIVNMCSKRLQLQEKLADDIAECIMLATGSPDVYVNITGDHACVAARGVKSSGITDVTVLKGRFLNDDKLRDEVERKAF